MFSGYRGKNFIDGQWLDTASQVFAKIDPCTEKEMALFPQSSPASVSLACEFFGS